MNPKIYCSQCHNSVFEEFSPSTPRTIGFEKEKRYLRCIARKKKLHIHSRIELCPYFVPEDKNRFLAGAWKPIPFQVTKEKK